MKTISPEAVHGPTYRNGGAGPTADLSDDGMDPAGAAPRPLLVLLETLEVRYADLKLHGEHVARHCEATALTLGFSRGAARRLHLAGTLHDVGKVGVSDTILTKPGALTPNQWRHVRRHPEMGANLLAASNLDDLSRWVLHHHERPDGRGYPHGLEDEEIPVESKIIATTDAYDAMRSHRAYRLPLNHEEACEELRDEVKDQRQAMGLLLPVLPTAGLKASVLGGSAAEPAAREWRPSWCGQAPRRSRRSGPPPAPRCSERSRSGGTRKLPRSTTGLPPSHRVPCRRTPGGRPAAAPGPPSRWRARRRTAAARAGARRRIAAGQRPGARSAVRPEPATGRPRPATG